MFSVELVLLVFAVKLVMFLFYCPPPPQKKKKIPRFLDSLETHQYSVGILNFIIRKNRRLNEWKKEHYRLLAITSFLYKSVALKLANPHKDNKFKKT